MLLSKLKNNRELIKYIGLTYFDKAISEWEDTQMNVLGVLISAHPLYVYVDYAMGKHQPWLGPQWTDALATGDGNNGWENVLTIIQSKYFLSALFFLFSSLLALWFQKE